MANPLTTVSDWVPNILNPKILFITENYPDNPNNIIGNTYFYRTLNQNIHIFGANNLLNNICKVPGCNLSDLLEYQPDDEERK